MILIDALGYKLYSWHSICMEALMRRLLTALLLTLVLVTAAAAGPLRNCATLVNISNGTATATSSAVKFQPYKVASFSVVATASNDSGTTPTLDLVVQNCRTASGSCKDWYALTQCTTGSCWTDGWTSVDVDVSSANWFEYFKVEATLAGTDPQYDYKVELCY